MEEDVAPGLLLPESEQAETVGARIARAAAATASAFELRRTATLLLLGLLLLHTMHCSGSSAGQPPTRLSRRFGRTGRCAVCKSYQMLLALLRQYIRPYRRLVAVLIGLQLISTLASLYLPTVNASIIDEGVAKGDTATIVRLGMVMLAVTGLQAPGPTQWASSASGQGELGCPVVQIAANRYGTPRLIDAGTAFTLSRSPVVISSSIRFSSPAAVPPMSSMPAIF